MEKGKEKKLTLLEQLAIKEKELAPKNLELDAIQSEVKGIISESEIEEDTVRVTYYLAKRSKRLAKKETLGIKDAIPSFEICLSRGCTSLSRCYDVDKKLYTVKSCEKLNQPLLTKYGKGKHKADLSHRDIEILKLGIAKLFPSDVAKGEDTRLAYLLSVLTELEAYRKDTVRIIV